MDLIGVSQTTFRRKEEAGEPVPDVARHRLMGYLRVVATLRRMLAESGDPEQVEAFDLEGWVAQDNVLINPAHADAANIWATKVRRFLYDHRV